MGLVFLRSVPEAQNLPAVAALMLSSTYDHLSSDQGVTFRSELDLSTAHRTLCRRDHMLLPAAVDVPRLRAPPVGILETVDIRPVPSTRWNFLSIT